MGSLPGKGTGTGKRNGSALGSIPDHAEHVIRLQPLAAVEKGQLDEECAFVNVSPRLLDELAAGVHRAAGGEEVVDQENPRARFHGVDVDLEDRRAGLPPL